MMERFGATWLDAKNYGFIFLLARIGVGVSLFVSDTLSFYILISGIAVAGFLVGINLMDLLRVVNYGANLSIGFYLYIFGIALAYMPLFEKRSEQRQASRQNQPETVCCQRDFTSC